jgi:hypothetical protein
VIRNAKKIVLYPRGGLGNQLFQYGAALQLANQLDLPIVINDALLGSSLKLNSGVGRRLLELDQFESSIALIHSPSDANSKIISKALTAQRLIGDKAPKLLLNLGFFSNEKQDQIEVFKTIKKSVSINSYCSSPSYFPDCQIELAEQISKIREPSKWYQQQTNELSEISPIGVHVRLGDYKNLGHIYGQPDPQYYATALDLVKDKIGERPVWLFSDEPKLAAEIAGKAIKIDRVVDQSESDRAIEHLNLLGKCQGIVCANSSFSWWAGFLSTKLNTKSTVVFPQPMFDTPDLKEPENWLLPEWLTATRRIGL